ncbi:DUF6461 domain-containing protein [Microtetraspora fusca]|uniref:DUF6461 domain-containing protein n=1 Tax=Microtetraspora fusca TaxID=1997 RepID=A0ABW6VK70_MICFU
MVELNRADFDWLRDTTVLAHAWSLTFVRGVDEAEALRRLGAQQVDICLFTKEECPLPEAVRAWRSGDWTVIIEVADCSLVDPKVTDALSAQTEIIMIFEDVNGWSGFEYVIDGQLMTSFNPVAAHLREGDEPDRLVEEMRCRRVRSGHCSRRRLRSPGRRRVAIRADRPTDRCRPHRGDLRWTTAGRPREMNAAAVRQPITATTPRNASQ